MNGETGSQFATQAELQELAAQMATQADLKDQDLKLQGQILKLQGLMLDLNPGPPAPAPTRSQGYFLGGNRWRHRDRWARPACGRAKGGGGDCQRQCEGGQAPEGQNCRSGGRVMLRTAAAGVWRERWRSAMRVPRRGRG